MTGQEDHAIMGKPEYARGETNKKWEEKMSMRERKKNMSVSMLVGKLTTNQEYSLQFLCSGKLLIT